MKKVKLAVAEKFVGKRELEDVLISAFLYAEVLKQI